MNIKLFEEYTGSKIGKVRLLPFRMHDISNEIELYNIANSIYAVKVNDVRIRCYLFLRYQKYYEGSSKSIRGNRFSIDQFIKWYSEEYKNKEMFTYAYDWCGFNIPSWSIEECLSKIIDENEYDRLMSNIFSSCISDNDGKNFYLLGVDSLDSDILDHEMAHGMYYTDSDYKTTMDEITESIPVDSYAALKKIILDMGYGDNVIDDEIQAYMSTGLRESMSEIPNLDEFLPSYRETFDHFLSKNKRGLKKMDF